MPPDSTHLWSQLAWLLLGAIPISAIAWTVTHEEVFRELHDYCVGRSRTARSLLVRKFFYLFTCEFCFSHYLALGFLLLTRYKLLMDNWIGYLIAFFALVYIANIYMSLYARLRVDITSERARAQAAQKEAEATSRQIEQMDPPRPRAEAPGDSP